MSSPLSISRRKSSSASATTSMDNANALSDCTGPSSPLPSSSPLRTPLHPTRLEWPANEGHDDGADGPWSSHALSHHPLPSLMSKFAAHKFRSDTALSYVPYPFSSLPHTTDSAISDDWEEYDLESMDIHIHETYFATSAERGRWLSSPVATRVRSQVVPQARGYSSPLKTVTDATWGHPCKQERSCSVGEQVADCDEDIYCPSPLPPSSPLSSPMSSFSFLACEYEDESTSNPRLNPDNHHSGTLEPRSTSMSPDHLTRSPSPRKAFVTASTLHPDFHRKSLSSHSGPHHKLPTLCIDTDANAPCNTDFETENILSPLSEPSSPGADPFKLPLSDTVNKPYPGLASVNIDPAWSQDGHPTVESSSMDPYRDLLDISFAVDGVTNCKKRKKESARGAKRPRKPLGGSSSNKRRRTETVLESAGTKSKKETVLGREVEQQSRSPSRPAVEHRGRESPCLPNKQRKDEECEPQCRIPTPTVDMEFQASLTGMLIEAFATSRATSMDSLALHGVLMQSHPHLATQRCKKELLKDISTVLEDGRARCGMFEKVDSSGEKSRDKVLDSRWFYVAERDEDSERAALVSALMPRQKRKETKKYKQYYYRPLDKMSRWDPEDAL